MLGWGSSVMMQVLDTCGCRCFQSVDYCAVAGSVRLLVVSVAKPTSRPAQLPTSTLTLLSQRTHTHLTVAFLDRRKVRLRPLKSIANLLIPLRRCFDFGEEKAALAQRQPASQGTAGGHKAFDADFLPQTCKPSQRRVRSIGRWSFKF